MLHYLRSGVLEVPPGISRAALLKEAEFYGLQNVISHLKALEAERKKEPVKKSRSNLLMYHPPSSLRSQ